MIITHRPAAAVTFLLMTLLIISGCNALPQAPTLTPTRSISAPTLAASPTVRIQSSGALYGDNIRSGQNDLTAAALPNDAAMPPLQATRDAASAAGNSNAPDIAQITLETGDVLIAELYTGSTESGERVPGVLMLGHERFNPGELPADIARAGFTVMVVELPTLTRVETLDTLLSSFSEQGSVDPGLIAVIGAEASADYALLGCAEYLICDAVVLLSPRGRDTLANVLPGINPRPIFVAAAPDDPEGYEAAEALSNGFAEQSRFFEATTGRGTTMLALNSGLGDEIITWLQTVLVGN